MTAWFYPYYSGLTKDIFIAFGPKFINIIVFGAEGTEGTQGVTEGTEGNRGINRHNQKIL